MAELRFPVPSCKTFTTSAVKLSGLVEAYRGFQVGCQLANANTLGIVVIGQLDEQNSLFR